MVDMSLSFTVMDENGVNQVLKVKFDGEFLHFIMNNQHLFKCSWSISTRIDELVNTFDQLNYEANFDPNTED